jgi:hypothetical protein
MSEAFSQAPPVYANSGPQNQSTSHPTTATSMPATVVGNPSHSYPHGYPQTQIPQNVYLDSLQSAVLNKVRDRLYEITQIGNAQIVSLKKTEQDLNDGEKTLQTLITDAQQQQIQAQVESYLFFFDQS